ncbi:MAG: FtsQ-type POTRA domain-containing protein [Oscillospiraceae bacterium]|nr:FtsQ-type POTRA domain-containing protein [Oscillospiraceae bacterium]
MIESKSDRLEIKRKVNAQKHRRKQKRRLIIFYIFLIISVVLISLFFIIHSFFKISEIKITGSQKYNQQQIKKILDLEVDENIFKYKSDIISKKIKNNLVYIDEANVKKKLPNKIFISLVDATPKYFIKIKDTDRYFILSKNMKILEEKILKNKNQKIDNLIQILGIDILDNSVGDFILKDDEIFWGLMESVETNKFKDITKIDITNKSSIKIIYQDRIVILLGKINQIDYKIRFINKIIERNLDKNEKGIIDATSIQKNSKVYFKPYKEPIKTKKSQEDKKDVSE